MVPVVIANFIKILANILMLSIIIRAVLSWVNPSWDKPVFRLLLEITEPILGPIRRIMPRVGMLDLSPLIAIVVLQFIAGAF
ncbi:MAG: YggT family protein [Chloroflexota bacterium]